MEGSEILWNLAMSSMNEGRGVLIEDRHDRLASRAGRPGCRLAKRQLVVQLAQARYSEFSGLRS